MNKIILKVFLIFGVTCCLDLSATKGGRNGSRSRSMRLDSCCGVMNPTSAKSPSRVKGAKAAKRDKRASRIEGIPSSTARDPDKSEDEEGQGDFCRCERPNIFYDHCFGYELCQDCGGQVCSDTQLYDTERESVECSCQRCSQHFFELTEDDDCRFCDGCQKWCLQDDKFQDDLFRFRGPLRPDFMSREVGVFVCECGKPLTDEDSVQCQDCFLSR